MRTNTATARPELVDVPPSAYLMIDGRGDPNTSPEYAAAIQALYSVSYGVKFAVRAAGGPEFTVSRLEGLFWVPDMSLFSAEDKDAWYWTMMIMQPDTVTADMVERARAKAPAGVAERLRLDRLVEGRVAQVLHVGPYAGEGPTIERLHAFIAEQGLRLSGRHHEIYLSDPRRTAPERLRTVIRQPVTAPTGGPGAAGGRAGG